MAAVVGCRRDDTSQATAGASRPSVALRIAVVNEPELAAAIGRLRGEWTERFGGSLSAEAKPWNEVAAGSAIDADAIVFPSRYLGELCVRGWLRPVRPSVLGSDELDIADVFPLIRRELMTWGGKTMALPLGVALPDPQDNLDGPPVNKFLALAAPKIVSDERLGAVFDMESMRPRIAEQPFVDALAQLARAKTDQESAPLSEMRNVPVLGNDDRLVAVAASSRNAASAFQLVAWLASADVSSQLAGAGGEFLPVRRSLAASSEWYNDKLSSSERTEIGKSLQVALSGQHCLVVPRIPGVDDYLAALDAAVESVVHENADPQAALEAAANEWEKITDAHGRDRQRAAYLQHLGIAGP